MEQIRKSENMKTINTIIAALGGVSAVAQICNISQPAVSKWQSNNLIPAESALKIYMFCYENDILVNGEPLTVDDIRPDIADDLEARRQIPPADIED